MSNALAIAAVTAVLKDLLDNGLIDHSVNDSVGDAVKVTAVGFNKGLEGGCECGQTGGSWVWLAAMLVGVRRRR